jgi:hypothetical protein
MNAEITYKEFSDFIEEKFKISPKFTTVDEKTLEVSYKRRVFMPNISVKFHIDAMRKDIICMSYDCGKPVSLMIAGIVAYLEEKIPSGIEVNTADKRINVYPLRFERLENVCEHVSLTNIAFQEQSIKMELTIL